MAEIPAEISNGLRELYKRCDELSKRIDLMGNDVRLLIDGLDRLTKSTKASDDSLDKKVYELTKKVARLPVK